MYFLAVKMDHCLGRGMKKYFYTMNPFLIFTGKQNLLSATKL